MRIFEPASRAAKAFEIVSMSSVPRVKQALLFSALKGLVCRELGTLIEHRTKLSSSLYILVQVIPPEKSACSCTMYDCPFSVIFPILNRVSICT